LSSCNYLWDVCNHGEAKAYFEMERMRQSTTISEQRAGYNNVLDRAFRHGNYDGEQFVEQLTQLRDQGEVDLTTDEIAEAGRDRSAVSTANFIAHYPISQKEQTFLGEALNRADHVNGAGWSNTFDRNMRQPNAHQRARNTGPHGLNNAVTAHGNNTLAAAPAGAAAPAAAATWAAAQPSFGTDCYDTNPNQYTDDEYAALTWLGVELSLDRFNQQQQQQTQQQTIQQQQQQILQQINNTDSLLSFASSVNGQVNTSISPMPSTITKTSAPASTFKSLEYKTKTCDTLSDFAFVSGDVDPDALAALSAFENADHCAHKAMHRVSKRLFDQKTKTPEMAQKMVGVYKSLEDTMNKRQRKND
jgi:hypothetical protein